MSCKVRQDQCCDAPGCRRPARYGALCTACFFAATPARRAAELSAHPSEMEQWDIVRAAELLLGE
ncbi:MAG TPA: hypothetical protein VE645_19145 [Pseudonocardiaceae bacterium]|nr:hypothetical protein [Pseudonocardiaceae bacterium]